MKQLSLYHNIVILVPYTVELTLKIFLALITFRGWKIFLLRLLLKIALSTKKVGTDSQNQSIKYFLVIFQEKRLSIYTKW